MPYLSGPLIFTIVEFNSASPSGVIRIKKTYTPTIPNRRLVFLFRTVFPCWRVSNVNFSNIYVTMIFRRVIWYWPTMSLSRSKTVMENLSLMIMWYKVRVTIVRIVTSMPVFLLPDSRVQYCPVIFLCVGCMNMKHTTCNILLGWRELYPSGHDWFRMLIVISFHDIAAPLHLYSTLSTS
jgi:hypothetical protein